MELEIIAGPMIGRTIELKEHDTLIFGRAPDCHICLPNDDFVSRHHFIIEACPPLARVRDLNSLNGTYVDEVRLGGRRKSPRDSKAGGAVLTQIDLTDGSEISVGQTRIRARMGANRLTTRPLDAHAQESTDGAASAITEVISAKRLATIPAFDGLRFVRQLGRGGMGIVYLVEDEQSEKQYAAKILAPLNPSLEAARTRFMREMGIMRTLSHPNLVRLVDDGFTGDHFYFRMEYCNGGNLDEQLARKGGTLKVGAALAVLRRILAGLAYAHALGLVHRDIKMSNILFHKDGGRQVKVADFGLAKNFELAGLSGLTATHSFGGTFPFMPREQLTDFKYVKPSADVWSTGALFYRMVTGEYPREELENGDPLETILESEIVPIRSRGVSLPDPVVAAIDRALNVSPEERFADASTFLAALPNEI